MTSKEEQVKNILDRGIIKQILPSKEEFSKALVGDKKLRFYIGADPTSQALHLSHAKNYMLLEEFRQLGHEVIVLIGDFTARIGDPTEKSSVRNQLSREEVLENVRNWTEQIKPLMNFKAEENPAKILYNNDWLASLTMEDVIGLASNVTVQQLLERDMFQKRIKEDKPIYLHEFIYPLMQGYDSVAMDVDVELCGTDQIFNALMGRTLMKKFKNKDKFVVAVNLMENPKTGELMSKSRGTGIFLNFSAEDMFGGIMSQPDEMIEVFLVNNTRISLSEIQEIMMANNPKDAKIRAAYEVTKIFHGEEKASAAKEVFEKKFQKRETPDEMEEIKIGTDSLTLQELVKKCSPNMSNAEIQRLISQGGVKINSETRNQFREIISLGQEDLIIKIGKKDWFKIIK